MHRKLYCGLADDCPGPCLRNIVLLHYFDAASLQSPPPKAVVCESLIRIASSVNTLSIEIESQTLGDLILPFPCL